MKHILFALLVLFTISSCNNNNNTSTVKKEATQWPDGIKAPVAAIKDHQRIIHGDTVTDNYYWMIDYFKKGPDSTQVVDYLKQENQYLDTMMHATKPLQEKLFTEMKSRIKEKDESVPSFKNGYYYYTRSEEGKQYYKYCRKKGSLDAKEEILLDVDAMAEGHPYFSATGFNISEDNKLLAYGIDTVSGGNISYTLRILRQEKFIKMHYMAPMVVQNGLTTIKPCFILPTTRKHC